MKNALENAAVGGSELTEVLLFDNLEIDEPEAPNVQEAFESFLI